MFRKQASPLHGYGLFSNAHISKYSFFDMEIEKKYKIRRHFPEKYLLDFFVPEYFSEDTICINDNKVDLLKNVQIDESCEGKRYVIVNSIYMFANDAAWPCDDELNYNDRTSKNNADFVLKFEKKKLIGICLILLRDVDQDEEICVTYGWNFWCE